MQHNDVRTLSQIQTWMVEDLVRVVVTLILYGIFIFLFLMTTNILLCRGRVGALSRTRWVIYGANIISLILGAINAAVEILLFTTNIRSFFLDYIDLPLHENLQLTDRREHTAYYGIGNWLIFLALMQTDTIIVWRVWALFPGRRWLLVGPIVFLVALIATSISYLVLEYGPSRLAEGASHTDVTSRLAQVITIYTLSISTNISTTVLVAYKFWAHRKTFKQVEKEYKSRVLNVLFLMIESGMLYALLQIIFIVLSQAPVLNLSTPVSDMAFQCFSAAYFAILPMYPTIFIAVVSSQSSITDDTHSTVDDVSAPKPRSPNIIPPNQYVPGSQLLPGGNSEGSSLIVPGAVIEGER